MGLFKPAWMSKDPKKRGVALARITNQEKLKKIVLTDMRESGLDWEDQTLIRKNCLSKIKDNQFLVQFSTALTEDTIVYWLGDAILKNIEEEMVLFYLASGHKNAVFAGMAVDKITNPEFLKTIAVDINLAETVRDHAVKRVSDEKILANLALNDPGYTVSMGALERITDDDVIAKVVFRPQKNMEIRKYSEFRKKAIKKLTNQPTLKQIALDVNEEISLRIAAARKLNDQPALLELVLHAESESLQSAAFNNITEQDSYSQISLANNTHSRAAAEKLVDDAFLDDVFLKCNDAGIKKIVARNMKTAARISLYESLKAGKVSDRTLLLEDIQGTDASVTWWHQQLADGSLDSEARSCCVNRLVQTFGDTSLLQQYIEINLKSTNVEFFPTILKYCTMDVIKLIESRVSAGDENAAVLMRSLYSAEHIPSNLYVHAQKQKHRFRDIHTDGHFGDCAGDEGHSDFIAKESIDPL